MSISSNTSAGMARTEEECRTCGTMVSAAVMSGTVSDGERNLYETDIRTATTMKAISPFICERCNVSAVIKVSIFIAPCYCSLPASNGNSMWR